MSFVEILLISQRGYKWIILCWFHRNLQNSLKNTSKKRCVHLYFSGNTLQKAYVCRREKLIWCFICKVYWIRIYWIAWIFVIVKFEYNIRKLEMTYEVSQRNMYVIIDLFAMFLISNFLFIAQNLNSKSNSKHFQTKHMDTSNQVYYTHI